MSAFNGSLVTPTREIDTSRDGTTSNAGSLILTAMCSPAALPGTTGACCDKISGDWCKKITGSATLNVGKYAVTNVGGSGGKPDTTAGSWTIYTAGDQKIKVGKNRSLHVNGSETNVTLGPTYETRCGLHHQHHAAPNITTSTWGMDVYWDWSGTYAYAAWYACGVYVNAYVTNLDLYGMRGSFGVSAKEASLDEDSFKALENEVHELKTSTHSFEGRIKQLESDIVPLKNQVGIQKFQFVSVRISQLCIAVLHIPAAL